MQITFNFNFGGWRECAKLNFCIDSKTNMYDTKSVECEIIGRGIFPCCEFNVETNKLIFSKELIVKKYPGGITDGYKSTCSIAIPKSIINKIL